MAFARALVTRDGGAAGEGLDPYADALLPAPIRAAAERLSPRAARALSLGIVDHVELRSLAIDAVARDVLGGSPGAAQLVVLGAGLDARAWRLPEAAGARCFEDDHPSTQRYKRARAPAGARDVRFVGVDFERDSLGARLAEAGHDARATTLWIWEGVTPYLPLDATRATLAVIAARSAPRSVLAVTYATPDMLEVMPALLPLAQRALSLLGEPLLGLVPREVFAAALADAGLDVSDDTGVDDWVGRFAPPRPPWIRVAERLAVARRS